MILSMVSKMYFLKNYLLPILFSIGLIAAALFTGSFVVSEWRMLLFVLFAFWAMRLIVKMMGMKNQHYKLWYKCLIGSYSIFVSLFVVADISFELSTLSAVLAAFLLSTGSDISEVHLWGRQKSGRPSKHLHVYDFIRANHNRDDVLSFEASLKYDGDYAQEVYRRIFKDDDTWDKTMFDLNINKQKLEAEIDAISRVIKHKFGVLTS